MTRVFTIGHSSHSLERFLELLRSQDIEVVADVRSVPYSRFNPHFKKDPLRNSLREAGFQYVHLVELGGKPADDNLRFEDGSPDYAAMARRQTFQDGLDRLIEGAEQYRVAIMCAEEDPQHCHRRNLVAANLRERGVQVVHIRAKGPLMADEELDDPQAALF